MTNEMKLQIALLEADGYKVDVITTYDKEEHEKQIKMASRAWCTFPVFKEEFYTTEFKVTKPVAARNDK